MQAMLPGLSLRSDGRVGGFGSDARKAPEIHLGYFTRVRGLWTLLDRVVSLCLQADRCYQVVNLGAGYDTLYWRLKAAAAGKVCVMSVSVFSMATYSLMTRGGEEFS